MGYTKMVNWFKKFSMFILIVLCSGFMLVGCKDKYDRMSLSLSHAGGTSTIELVLADGAAVSYEVTAKVEGAKKGVSDEVLYSIDNGKAIEVSSEYKGDGETTLTITAKAHGKCTLTVTTKEGNKQDKLTIIVYKKVTNVEFSTDKLAIKKNSTLNLNDYITYTPGDTNQTEMNYELVGVTLEDGTPFVYSENYAKITDGILTVDPEATLPVDPDTNLPYVTVKGTSAHDINISTEVLNIPIIDMVSEELISLQSNSNSGQVTLVKNGNGEYHVVLASNVGFTDLEGTNSVLFKRRLTFIVGNNLEEEQFYDVVIDEKYLESYQTNPNRTEAEKQEFSNYPVLISKLDRLEGHVVYDINQKLINNMVVPFHIKYTEYAGLPDIVIKVRFEVVAFPTEISAKHKNQEVTETNPLKVMNKYSGNLSGTPLTITTNNDKVTSGLFFQYTFDKGSAPNPSVIVATSDPTVLYEEGKNIYTGTTLYLFHDFKEDVENITDFYLVITYTYDLNPAAIAEAGGATLGNFSYTIERKIPLTFRSGLDAIPFTQDIVDANYILKINASKPAEAKIIDTSNSVVDGERNEIGGIYADEFTYTADTDLFTLRIEQKEVFVVPNTIGLSGEYNIYVRDTMRNLFKSCKVIVYVPFATTEEDSMYLEINSENNYKEEILDRTYEPKEIELLTSGETPVELTKTYETLTTLTLKTNSSVPLRAYNYIMDPALDSSGVKADGDLEAASRTYIKRVDIMHYIESVSIPYKYGSFDKKSGVLTVGSNTWTNTESPVDVVFVFRGYDAAGDIVTVKHTVKLLIYNLINSLTVSISNPNVFEYNSVGALNAHKATSTITVTNTLNNAATIDFEVADYIVKAFKRTNKPDVVFTVRDLITVNYTPGSKSFTIVTKLSGSATEEDSGIYNINQLLRDYGSPDNILAELYATNFKIDINITLNQFNRKVYSTVSLGTMYAVRTERIILNNVNSSGLYFDIRELSAGDKRDISFTIEPSNAYNKTIRLIYDENNVFNCEMLSDNIIRVYPYSAGVATLRLAFEDSYEEVVGENGVVTLVATKYVDIRIKVADGSEQYPFEIYDVDDLEGMIRDINSGNNSYNYVLAQDLNLRTYNYVAPTEVFRGSLNGLFEYELDGTRYSIQNSIIGFNMRVENEAVENIGMFSVLADCATIKNMNFIETNINVTMNEDFTRERLYIGVIAGISNGTIINSRVLGAINVTAYADNFSVGGFVGESYGVISGLPSVNNGLGDSNINSNVAINVHRINSVVTYDGTAAVSIEYLSVGGVAGFAGGRYGAEVAKDVGDFLDLNVISNITAKSYFYEQLAEGEDFTITEDTQAYNMAVGGLSGGAVDAKINNVTVRAKAIRGLYQVGGMVGQAEAITIYNSVVQFVNDGATGINAANIVGQSDIGGMIGLAVGNTKIEYSYVRSFYGKKASEIDNSTYYGNIVSIANIDEMAYALAVGGLVGTAADTDMDNRLIITNSYFNADINASVGRSDAAMKDLYYVGGLVGCATPITNIANSYVVGNIIMPAEIKETTIMSLTKENVDEEGGATGSGGGSTEETEPYINEDVTIEIPSFGYFVGNEREVGFMISNILDVVSIGYSVVNHDSVKKTGFYSYVTNTNELVTSEVQRIETFVEEGTSIEYRHRMDKDILLDELNETNGFHITSNHEYNQDPANVDKKTWYTNAKLNDGFPVLFGDNDDVLYTILPSSITAVVNENPEDFTNNSHIKVDDNKVVLFYNAVTSGVEYLTNNVYKIVVDDNVINTGVDYNNVININLGVDPSLQGIVEVESAITIESSDINIVAIENGNTIRTLGEGLVTLHIYSTLDTTIETSVQVLVVNGFSDFNLYKNGIGDANIVTTEEQFIIDHVNKFNVNVVNKANINGIHAVYRKNGNMGYIITADEYNEATIGINTLPNGVLENNNSYLFSSLGNMNLIGFTSGSATLRFTPVLFTQNEDFGTPIYVDGTRVLTDAEVESAIAGGTIGNYTKYVGIIVEDIAKEYTFNVIEKARSLTFTNGVTSKTILPTGRAELEINVVTSAYTKLSPTVYEINEKLNVLIYHDGIEIGILNLSANESSVEYEAGKFKDRYNNSLISFELNRVTYEPIEGENQVRVTYMIFMTFDQEKYLNNADIYSMNELDYVLRFFPATNTALKELETSKYLFTIEPQEIDDITAAFYPSAQTTLTNEFNPLENPTDYIAPGRYGLLIINVYPKFNEADYYEVKVPYEYRKSISLTQMYARYDNSGTSALLTGYQTAVPSAVKLSDYMGIRLFSISNTTREFDGKLYVRILVTDNVPEGTVLTFEVNAYKEDGTKAIDNPVPCTVSVSPLPGISAVVDGMVSNILVPKTFTKVGTIKAVEFSGDIQYEIVSRKGNAGHYKVEISADGTEFTFTALESAFGGDDVTVTFTVYQVINGIKEESTCRVYFKIIEYQLTGVSVKDTAKNDAGENQLDMLNGVSKKLEVVVSANMQSDNPTLAAHKASLEKYFAGIGTLSASVKSPNNWYRRNNYNADPYNDISLNVDAGKLIFNQYEFEYKNEAYYLKATRISDVVILALKVAYYYDGNGYPRVFYTGLSTTFTIYEMDFVFRLNIKDNSTYDHPNPVYTYEDIAAMQTGSHYILMNNLTFTDFVPFKCKDFASFDGNGFMITIENFDLSSYKTGGNSTVNVGLFESIAAGTIVKNLVLDVSQLLISEYEMTMLLNSTNTEVISKYNIINASDITNLNFGLIAATNAGTLTNIKVINTKSTNNNYLYVYTTQSKIGTTTPSARIAGFASTNSGVISNSFIGVNASAESSDGNGKVYIGGAAGSYNTVYSYPFRICGSNNVSGMAHTNSGKVISSYANAVGVINTSFLGENTITAGLVGTNTSNGVISNAFVQGNNITGFRADNTYKIESKGNMGGLVCVNQGAIKDAYANIAISTNSGRSGGFVFSNESTGTIKNAYSTAKNSIGSRAHGAFIGTNEIGEVNNQAKSSSLSSIYYLVVGDEFVNESEVATPVRSNGKSVDPGNVGVSQSDPFLYAGSFNGFSFSLGNSKNSIWTYTTTDRGPQLISCVLNDTYSNRIMTDAIPNENTDGGEVTYTYNYEYIDNVGEKYTAYGQKNNPLIVRNAKEFATFIINNANAENVFGGENSTVSYVRMIDDINFAETDSTEAFSLNETKVDGKLLSDITFNGTLDGNNLKVSGIVLLDSSKGTTKDTYGLFKQVGHDINSENYNATIKNVTFEVDQLSATQVKMVGTVAGKSVNTTYINTHILGEDVMIQGRNIVGGLTGIIAGNSSIIDVTSNISVSAVYRTSGVEISNVLSYFDYGYNMYDGDYEGNLSYDKSNCDYSYAGGIAGIIDVNNTDILDKDTYPAAGSGYLEEIFDVVEGSGATATRVTTKYRTDEPTAPIVKDLKVSGFVSITGEMAGGLFGYVGDHTHVYNSMFELTNESSGVQLINGVYLTGGIAAENHGILEKVRVEHAEDVQAELDLKVSTEGTIAGRQDLFRYQTNTSIIIGGIVGLNNNAIIIDSFSKANVYNANAYVAGGVIGKNKGYALLQHVYTTGLVYSKYVMGGIIGYANVSKYAIYNNEYVYAKPDYNTEGALKGYVSPTNEGGVAIPLTYNEKIVMDYVVAANTWNAETDQVMIDNFKSTYSYSGENAETKYYSYTNAMPEVGNQFVESMYRVHSEEQISGGNTITVFENDFESSVSKEFKGALDTAYVYGYQKNIGSIVGRVSSFGDSVTNESIAMEIGGASDDSFNFTVGLLNAFDTSVSFEESINADHTKSVKELAMEEVTVYSVSSGSNILSNEDIEWTGGLYTTEYCTYNYYNYLGWQRERKYILGYEIEINGNETANLMTNNAFMKWISIGMGDDAEKVFRISEESGFPAYIVGIYSNMITIDSSATWTENIGLNKTTRNKFYAITSSFSMTTSENFGRFEGNMIGVGDTKPTITIHVNGGFVPVFDMLSSANISNVDFNIIIMSQSEDVQILFGDDMGIFASTVKNTVLTNCSISINFGNVFNGGQDRTFTTQNNKNMGGVFGQVLNSTLRFGESDQIQLQNFGMSKINIKQINDFNFGLFAGYVEQSDISYLPIKITENTAVRVGLGQLSLDKVAVGGIIGSSRNTNYPNINIINRTQNIDVYLYTTVSGVNMEYAYVGGIIGKLEAGSVNKIAHNGGVYVGPNEVNLDTTNKKYLSVKDDATNLAKTASITNIYAGGVVGYMTSASGLTNASNGFVFDTTNNASKVSKFESEIYVNGYKNAANTSRATKVLAVGGIVGRMSNGTIIGQPNDDGYAESANYADITTTNVNTSSLNYVGGIVGQIEGVQNPSSIEKVFNEGDITFSSSGTTNYVGGIVGGADAVDIDKAYNNGYITQSATNHITGGIIGALGKKNTTEAAQCNITNCISYADIYVEAISSNAILGGILGSGMFNEANKVKISDSISMSRPINTNANTAYIQGIATNVEGSDNNNYYIAEFATAADIGTAVIYGQFKQTIYDKLCNIADSQYSIVSYGAQETITPRLNDLYTIKDYYEADMALGGKFNPIYIEEDHADDNDDIEKGQNYYYILKTNITITSNRATNFTGLIASTNDYTLTYSGNQPFIITNNGILSGVKMLPTNNNNTSYLVEGNDVSGVIYNCGIMGVVSNKNLKAPIAETNEGRILQTGVSLLNNTTSSVQSKLGGFVYTNKAIIQYCYSTYQMPNIIIDGNAVYGLVVESSGNAATLNYSYFAGYYNGEKLAAVATGTETFYESRLTSTSSKSTADFLGGTDSASGASKIGSTWRAQNANTENSINYGYPLLNTTFKNTLSLTTKFDYDASQDTYLFSVAGAYLLITHDGMFANMSANSTGVTYLIASNITISTTYSTVSDSGEFEGKIRAVGGKTITTSAPLFEKISGSTIQALTISTSRSVSSVLAKTEITNSNILNITFNNCEVSNSLITPTYTTTTTNSIKDIKLVGTIKVAGNGAIIGAITGASKETLTVENINSSTPIELTYTSSPKGGLFGSVEKATIKNSYNITDLSSSSNIGGLVGTLTDSIMDGCVNKGGVSGGGIVGGLVAESSNSEIKNSSTNNYTDKISGKNYVGGIVGNATGSITLNNVTNVMDISGEKSYVGGIIGKAATGTFYNTIYNSGDITMTTIDPTFVGGVIGSIETMDNQTVLDNSGDITISLTQASASTLNKVSGANFGFAITEMQDAGDYFTYSHNGKNSFYRGATSPTTIKSNNSVGHVVGNKLMKSGYDSYGSTITVKQNYASYYLWLGSGLAYGKFFGNGYKGLEFEVNVRIYKYEEFSYEDDNVIDYDYSVDDTSYKQDVNLASKNGRKTHETISGWNSKLNSTTWTFSMFS